MRRLFRSTTLAALTTLASTAPALAQDAFEVWPARGAAGAAGEIFDLTPQLALTDGVYDSQLALDPFDGFTSRISVQHPGSLTVTEGFAHACSPETVVELHAWDPSIGLWMHQQTQHDTGDGCTAFTASVGPGHYAVRVIGGLDATFELATTADLMPGEPLEGGFAVDGGDRYQWYGTGAPGSVTVCTSDGAGGCPGDTMIFATSAEMSLIDDDGGDWLCSCLTLDASQDWQIDVVGYGRQAVGAYTLTAR